MHVSETEVKVKQTLFRPGKDLSVPGGWGHHTIQDNRHVKMVRLPAPHTGRIYPPGNIPGTHL